MKLAVHMTTLEWPYFPSSAEETSGEMLQQDTKKGQAMILGTKTSVIISRSFVNLYSIQAVSLDCILHRYLNSFLNDLQIHVIFKMSSTFL